MKEFLLKLFWFILPIIILSLPLDLIISRNLKKSDEISLEFETWNDIYENNANCEIAIYGSSRGTYHFNPQILENSLNKSVYNFGFIAHNFEMQYLRHLELIKLNQKPKLIILSLDIFGLTKRPDIYAPEQFLPFLLFNKNMEDFTTDYKNGFSKFDFYLPLIRYTGKTKALTNSLQNVFRSNDSFFKTKIKGYFALPNEWNEINDRNLHKKEKNEIIIHQSFVNLFERFIIECKNNKIDLVLVYSPEYIENQQWETNRKEVMQIYRKFSQKYDLIFLDYSKDELSYYKDNFFDSNHLTGKSADIFTTKFAEKLKELGY